MDHCRIFRGVILFLVIGALLFANAIKQNVFHTRKQRRNLVLFSSNYFAPDGQSSYATNTTRSQSNKEELGLVTPYSKSDINSDQYGSLPMAQPHLNPRRTDQSQDTNYQSQFSSWQQYFPISETTASLLSMIQNRNDAKRNFKNDLIDKDDPQSNYDAGSRKWSSKASSQKSVIFSNDFNSVVDGKQKRLISKLNKLRLKELAADDDTSSRDDTMCIRLDYNHLATTSLDAIEALPAMKLQKGDKFLLNWWLSAKEWGVLSGECALLDAALAGSFTAMPKINAITKTTMSWNPTGTTSTFLIFKKK